MSEHLTDLQFAVLLERTGGSPLREALLDHVTDCTECGDRLAALIRLRRQPDAESVGALQEHAADRLLRAFQAATRPSRRNVVPLRPLRGPEPQLALAADSGGEEAMPVLSSPDGRLLVRFRRVGAGLRGYVIAREGTLPSQARLRFLPGDDTYAIDEHGEVDLPAMTAQRLASGSIEIHLEDISTPSG